MMTPNDTSGSEISETIDTFDRRYVICPWCGHKHDDGWSFFTRDDDVETECDRCELPFTAHRLVDVDYETEKIEK